MHISKAASQAIFDCTENWPQAKMVNSGQEQHCSKNNGLTHISKPEKPANNDVIAPRSHTEDPYLQRMVSFFVEIQSRQKAHANSAEDIAKEHLANMNALIARQILAEMQAKK